LNDSGTEDDVFGFDDEGLASSVDLHASRLGHASKAKLLGNGAIQPTLALQRPALFIAEQSQAACIRIDLRHR
jgi:hypothetical protein